MFVLEYDTNQGGIVMKKTLGIILLMATMLFTFMPSVYAKGPSSIRTGHYGLQEGYVANYHWNKHKLTNGEYVYCMDITRLAPENRTLTYLGELDAGYAYLLANGYSRKSFTGNSDYDYYITQGAIYWYIDRINGLSDSKSGQLSKSFKTTGKDSHNLRPHMKNLLNQALKVRNEGYVTPTGSLSVSTGKLSLSSDKTYFISSPITLSTKTGTLSSIKSLNVKLEGAPSGSKLVDKNGNTKTSFRSGDVFYVKVPKSSLSSLTASMSVVLTGTGVTQRAARYDTGNSKYQRLAKYYEESNSFSSKLNFSLSTTKTTISKIDITTKKELPGATMVVKDSNGKVVDQWVSGTTPHVIEGLPAGKYTLTETIAPDGYVRAETITFEVKDGQATTVTMKDDYTKLKISKKDITTEEELPGAHLVIKNADGKVIDEWVSTDEEHYIEKIKPGVYTLEETIAPDGYIRAETIEFEVLETGDVQTVTMVDDYTKVEISKQDVTTKKELAGAQLRILDEEGNTIKQWISTEEPMYLEKLKVGKYKLVEEVAPEGYVLAREALEFEVLETGDKQTVVMFNTPLTPTPDTAFHVSTMLYIAAALIGCAGIGMVYWNAKKRA